MHRSFHKPFQLLICMTASAFAEPPVDTPIQTQARTTGNAILEGVVVNQAGQPVPFAEVREISASFPPSVMADEQGRFRLAATGAAMTNRSFLASNRDGSFQGTLKFDRGEELRAIVPCRISLTPSRSVSVQVVDERGVGVGGAHVFALDYVPLVHTRSDEHGKAKMQLPPDAISEIIAIKPGKGIGCYDCMPDFPPDRTVFLPPEARIQIKDTRPIRFRAVDEQGKPLARVKIEPFVMWLPRRSRVLNLSGCTMPPFDLQTDHDGIAVCDWLPPVLEPQAQFVVWEGEYYCPDIVHCSTKMKDQIFEFRCQQKIRVGGKVLKADGTPAAGILIKSAGFGNYTTRSASDGSYSFLVPRGRPNSIAVTDVDFVSETVSRIDRESTSDVNLKLIEGTVVSGRITQGSPPNSVADYSLSFRPKATLPVAAQPRHLQNNLSRSTASGADERFSIRIAPGSFDVHGSDQYLGFVKIGDEVAVNRDFVLAPSRTLSLQGKVTNPDGSPAAGIQVRAMPFELENGTFARTRTDANGVFRFERGRARQTIYAFDPERCLAAKGTLTRDDNLKSLQLQPAAEAKLRLIDENKKPMQDTAIFVTLVLDRNAGTPNHSTMVVYTDQTGAACVRGLAPGIQCRFRAQEPQNGILVTIAKFQVDEAKVMDLGERVAVDSRKK